MAFQFPSKKWEIKIFFLIEESSKTFNLHPLFFHLRISEISFSNSRLFPHVDDHLLQKHHLSLWSIDLHPPVRGGAVVIHHAAEMLAGVEGLSHALRRWLNVVVGCGSSVCCRVPVFMRLLIPHRYSCLWKYTNHIFSSLYIHFLLPSQF